MAQRSNSEETPHPLHEAYACLLEPAVAARARKLGPVLAVKVRHVPARKAALVQLHNVIDLRPTGTAFGYLAQPLVQQPLQSIRLKSLNVAAKAALALAQY
jgi:hypothetical protein